jgi:hypothetical protein
VINFSLILAVDHERNGFAEFPLRWTAIESDKGTASKLEFDNHDPSGFLAVLVLTGGSVALDAVDLGIRGKD